MSERKYPPTPGPWVYEYGAVYTSQGVRLLLADRSEELTRPVERDSNCQLAAAAPDLLEALRNIVRPLKAGVRVDWHVHIKAAEAAIAKATHDERPYIPPYEEKES